jgi:signal transduction histidine kinase
MPDAPRPRDAAKPEVPRGGALDRGSAAASSYPRIMRWGTWRDLAPPRRVDLVIAAGLLAWGLPDVPWWWEPSGHAGTTPDVLGSLALTLAMSVPFCWRRRFPVPVLVAAGSVLAIRAGLHRNEVSAFAAVLVAAYGLGAYSVATRRYARWLGLITLGLALVILATSAGRRLEAVPFALLGAAFVLGDAASARRGEMAAAVEAAHQAERTRIARELHDVVAHQLSAIAVQAGAARLAAAAQDRAPGEDGLPGEMTVPPGQGGIRLGGPGGLGSAAEVLGTVERLSREALAELSHLLGALRREPVGAAVPPAPTLAELGTLVATTRAAGVPVELTVAGNPRPLSPGTELSGYRIVSEALANVARHAPGAATRVTLRYGAAALEIEVRNAAPPHPHRLPAGPASGRGLGVRGMRERAELYGGVLAAGPGPDGGFTVTATIPVAEASADATAPNAMTRGERAPGATGADTNVLPRNAR